jgi:hypothetical protein
VTLAEGTLLTIQTLVPTAKAGPKAAQVQPPSPAALKASYNAIVLQGNLAQYEIH